jgi:aspartate aminotransferase-like enzyme
MSEQKKEEGISSNQSEPLLLTPGPTMVPPSVRQAMARPMIHHRTAEFQSVLKEVGAGLQQIFKTSSEVLILTSSGTGAMEAAVANLISPGETVLVIRGGKFGERWAEIANAFGARVVAMDPPWGKALDFHLLSKMVQEHPHIKAVFATLCETSTGVHYDIEKIRHAIGEKPLLVVDAISGLGADPFAMDAFGVDVAVCGSQKGLMLPPGLAFIALNARAWEAVDGCTSPRYYYDLRLARKAWKKTDTPFTPAISLVIGLAESLRFILAKGWDRFVERHQLHARKVRQAAVAMGLELFAEESVASSAVTTLKVPNGIDGKELLRRIQQRYGIWLAGGQGKELEGKVVRIATMGCVGEDEVFQGLAALQSVLKEMGWKQSFAFS